MKTRAISLLLAICMLIGFLPTGLLTANAAAASSYTYNYMKMDAFASPGSVGSAPLVKDYVTDFGLTLTGSATDKAPSIESAGWKAGSLINGGNWEWTWSADVWGLYWLTSAGAGSYNSIDIQVPESGTYQVDSLHSVWSAGGTVEMYIAAAGTSAADILAGNYVFKSGAVNHYAATTAEADVTLTDSLTLTAGDYTVLYYQTSSAGQYFVRGLRLINAEVIAGVSFAADELSMILGEVKSFPAKVSPNAANQAVSYESSDSSVASVDAAGVITAKKIGTATITATSDVDTSKRASVTVTVNSQNFSFDFKKNKAVTSNPAVDGFGANPNYHGTYWMWTGSSPTYGFYFGNAFDPYKSAGDDSYAMIDVIVPAAGTYQITSVNSVWAGGGTMDFYIVPTADAADFLTKGTKLNNEPVNMYAAAIAGDQLMALDNTVDLEAGAYTVVYDVVTMNQGFYITGLQFDGINAVKSVTLDCEDEVELMLDTSMTVKATVLPEILSDKSVVWTSSDDKIATVANGVITAKKLGSAVIKAASAADATKYDTVTVTVTPKNFSFDYMKRSYSPVPTKIANYIDIDGFGPNELHNEAFWLWTGSSGAGGFYLGNAFAPYQSATDATYAMIDVKIPVAGTYQITSIHTLWTAGGTLDFYIVPTADAADFLTKGTKLNNEPVNTLASAIAWNQEVPLENTVELQAGDYTVVYDAVTLKSGYYIAGLQFVGVDSEVPVEAIDLGCKGIQFLGVNATMTVNATISPAAASNKNLIWTSSDESIATVTNGVVTGLKNGVTTIRATAEDGYGATAELQLLVCGTADYNYKIRESLATVSSSFMVPSESDGGFSTGYEASQNANVGSAPWMYDSGTKKLSYSGSTVAGYGVFVDYGNPGDYARLKIKVGADGAYHMILNHDMWYGSSGAFDVYLAPVAAKDPVASEYLIYGWTPTAGIATSLRTDVYIGEADIPQGEYYLTIMFKAPSASKLIGISDFRLYKSGEIDVYTTEGASIRVADGEREQGLRFYSTISKDIFAIDQKTEGVKVKEYGTILLPTEDLNGNPDNLKFGYSANGHNVAKSVAERIYDRTDSSVIYTSVLIRIPTSAFATSISARAYVILEDDTVIYSDHVSSRSIYEVAQKILACETATAAERAAAQAVVDAVAAQ